MINPKFKKWTLTIYGWIILSIICQVFVYTLIDKVYLKNRENMLQSLTTKKIDSNEVEPVKEEAVSINIPTGALDIKVSTDGAFVAYLLNKKVNIVEVEGGKLVKTIENTFLSKDVKQTPVEGNISCFKWIPGKNMMIYAVISLPNAQVKGQVYTYGLDTEITHISKNIFTEGYMPRGGEISDIAISPLTMVYYARVKVNQTQDRFFRVDIMDDFYPSIYVPTATVSKIGYYSEDLIYTENTHKLNVKTGNKSPILLTLPEKVALLGVGGIGKEAKDNIYAGLLTEDGKVNKIIYGTASTKVEEWKKIELNNPIAVENLIIKEDGFIYSINGDNSILDLESKNKTTFNGKFVSVTTDHVVSLVDGKLNFKKLKGKE